MGAAAAAASLREELLERGALTSSDFDEAYALARLTPGTNLLAMYVLLGKRLGGGWRGAAAALAAGAVIPAAIAGMVAAGYVQYAGHPLAARAMQGARAGALAVILWAVVKLLRPQLLLHGVRAVVVAATTLAVTLTLPIPQVALLIVAGVVGAVLRREL